MQFYQVGGAVRDRLLGRAVKDRDWVVVGSTPEQMRRLGFRQVGSSFPIFLHPRTGEEYALARSGPRDHTHALTPSWGPEVTLEDDLRRRDLTINAIAVDETGELIDPFGGRADLKAGILRHVSGAFTDDPLRVLRVARFAARYGFRVAGVTLKLMTDLARSGTLDDLVPERVWLELVRALGEPWPRRFFECLRACKALARVFPEIDRLFGVPQPARHHPEGDTGRHVMLALEQAARRSNDPRVRFAVLLHDVGKGLTPRDQWPHHVGHEAAGARLIQDFCQRLHAPREYRDLALLAALYHSQCHRAAELRPGTVVKLLGAVDALRRPQRFERFLSACEADATGRTGRENAPYPQAGMLRTALEAVRSVGFKSPALRGLSGQALASELHRLRVDAVRGRRQRGDESGEVDQEHRP